MTLETYKDTHRSHWLPVDDPRHTEVLGGHCTTKDGKLAWDRLDWAEWWLDGPEPHLFNPGGSYFHVPVKDTPNDPADGRVYRVRCWYAGGIYRGWKVRDIGIGFRDGKLHWIVRTEKEPAE